MSQLVQELNDFVDRWYDVFPKGDAAAMSDLYTENARLMLASMPAVRGSKAIGDFLGGFPTHVDMDCAYEVTDIDIQTDNIAVVTGASWNESKPKAGGDTIYDAAQFVMIMHKDESGAWRCHYDISQYTPDVTNDNRPK